MAAMYGKNSEGVRGLSGKRLFIYGAGGLGREVLRLSRRINLRSARWSEISFVDDGCLKKEVNDAPVLRFDAYLAQRREDDAFVIATGETVVRKRLWEKLTAQGIPLETLVSPEVYLDEFDTLQDGCILTEGTILGGNNTFGLCSYVNLGCQIGHNSWLGAFSTLSPGCIVSGDVTIGDGTYIGTGAVIRDEVTIGKNCIIGMGSLVTKDIPDNVVAYGSPCQVVRENMDGIVFG